MLLLLFIGIGTDTAPVDTSGHHVVRRTSPLRFDVVAEPLSRDEDDDLFVVRIL